MPDQQLSAYPGTQAAGPTVMQVPEWRAAAGAAVDVHHAPHRADRAPHRAPPLCGAGWRRVDQHAAQGTQLAPASPFSALTHPDLSLACPLQAFKNLDEIYAGVCDGMTYEEIAQVYPEEAAARKADKFGYAAR